MIIIILSSIFVFIALLGFIFERIAQRQALTQFPVPGQLINVGDYQLHLYVTGESNDKPTVILEAGNGGFSTQWVHIQNELSKHMQVISYDRAGYGWSDASPNHVDLTQNVQDLQNALDQLGIEPPYIFVGHSMGGLFNLSYASQYPDNIVGMVFVDSTHPDMWQHFPVEMMQQQDTMIGLMQLMRIASNFGLMRLFHPLQSVVVDLPQQEQESSLALSANPTYINTFLEEAKIVRDLPNSMPAKADLSNFPLLVLSANSVPEGQTMPEGVFEIMHGLHQEFASESNKGNWRLMDGANHYSIIMDETYARQIVQAVLDIAN